MKQTIRAFAIGLATATALLTFTYYQTKEQSDSKPLTDQEAIKHLEGNDYHVLSESSFEDLQKQESEQKDKETKEVKKSKSQKDELEQTEESSFSLIIEPGTLSSTISEDLKKAGIIDDQAKFEIYLKDNDYSRSIQIGTYEIKQGMTYEEIAKRITDQ